MRHFFAGKVSYIANQRLGGVTMSIPESQEPTRAEIDAMTGKVLVEIGATWCGHCQAAQPEIERQLKSVSDVRHIKIEDGKGRPVGRSFGVKLWPTLVLMRDGEVLEKLVRPSDHEIAQAFEQFANG
jgi:thioredoxin 1